MEKKGSAVVVGKYPDGRLRVRSAAGAEKDITNDVAVAYHKEFGFYGATVDKNGKLIGTQGAFPLIGSSAEVSKSVAALKFAAAPKLAAPKPAASKPVVAPIAQSTVAPNGVAGKTFCVTGPVEFPGKRAALHEYIQSQGGFIATSITNSVDYLITNDADSGSRKNRDAVAKGVTVITEPAFLRMAGYTD
jgi:NAD-dependent DNA ligase